MFIILSPFFTHTLGLFEGSRLPTTKHQAISRPRHGVRPGRCGFRASSARGESQHMETLGHGELREYHGIIMEISWKYHGNIMEISWKYHGNIMGLSWKYHGNIMGLSWKYHGIIMEISWKYHGNIMGLSWKYHGFNGEWWFIGLEKLGKEKPETQETLKGFSAIGPIGGSCKFSIQSNVVFVNTGSSLCVPSLCSWLL